MTTIDRLADIGSEGQLAALCAALLDRTTLTAPEAALVPADVSVTSELLDLVRADITEMRDPLGEAFLRLRPPEERRGLGQFYTPDAIIAAMTKFVTEEACDRAVDAGCGSGRYAVALARAGFPGDIVAVDVDPLATLMTRAHARAAGVAVEVRQASFLTLDLPAISGRTAWFGNPPYLRHHSLTAEAKAWAKRAGKAQNVPVSGLAGLHALFFLAVAEMGQAEDVGCFITSSEWFDARYGSVVRDLLTSVLPMARLDIIPPSVSTFDDADTTAVITTFRVRPSTAPTTLVRTIDDPTALRGLTGGEPTTLSTLAGARSWTATLSGRATEPGPGMCRLREHLRVSRGLATGANNFFVMTLERATALGLAAYARPLVSKAAEVLSSDGTLRATGTAKVLLAIPAQYGDDKHVTAYLAEGEATGIHEKFLCSQRGTWWCLNPNTPPPVLASYMARQPPRFALNPDGLLHLNNAHGLRPQPGFPVELVPVLVAWLNDNRAGLVGGRTYAGGLMKLEPSDMGELFVPDLGALRGLATTATGSRR